jgi:hypothetical protein
MILSALTPFFETSCSHRLERDRFGSCTSRNKQAINATIVMTTPKPGQSDRVAKIRISSASRVFDSPRARFYQTKGISR